VGAIVRFRLRLCGPANRLAAIARER